MRTSHGRAMAFVTALVLGETKANAEILREALEDDPAGMILALGSLSMGLVVHSADMLGTTPEDLLRRLGPGIAEL